ncbi:Nuclear hormone receptor family member nhr-51 [Caenorhabditis elegans]|uniref:Nuclear hormone receptor family member nhr-51 n=2 Tax=Caenorhabditis elegans TaxID=6239 RepID=NHR51_CAEEL|nr:Nuclear hormone receptor family member nhr-51 [Caenorhabditis elegans]O17927.3 RecName: Full=Nuclear hormone receptor family member nhr-51 [Caenorhabditis elegans]CAB05760.3 Nuclear hormone receptor family member nhr-51 [Caenorhabditis elegans]|eukprot:NP_506898.2 Nuclear hormone receptor family member nhr-51 [Caenorhabditis elegans]
MNKNCLICHRKAAGQHYGVLSCFACKMFFHRMVVENLHYCCQKFNKCYEKFIILPKCKACRYQKCLEMGMQAFPRRVKSFEESMDLKIQRMLMNLSEMDEQRHWRMLNSYSIEDPSLGDVLVDSNVMKIMRKPSNQKVTAHEWAFLDVYSRISHFSNFEFMNNISFADRKLIFSFNCLRTGVFHGSMRTLREQRDCLLTPSGEDVYPDAVHNLFKDSPGLLNRTCCLLVSKLIELKVTNEEYQLLSLIFFCNPTISHNLSDFARNTLASHQIKYSSALFRHLQITNPGTAPVRFQELISLVHVINRVTNDMQHVSMMFQCMIPSFKFKQLVTDTFVDCGVVQKKSNVKILNEKPCADSSQDFIFHKNKFIH